MIKKDDGSKTNISLLRPLWWFQKANPIIGKTINIHLPEMGISGNAQVLDIEACNVDSRLIPDDQKIVIGKFVHENAEVLDLIFENEFGEREKLGVTSEHPIYSKDRNCWVPAGNLHTNENVKTSDNLKVWLVEKSQRLGKHKVYNLEIHKSHTFFVSKLKILGRVNIQ